MNKTEDFLKELQSAELIWMDSKQGHAMYEVVYKGELLKMRLNDFPDEVAFTLFVRGEEIDLEERPKTWHFAPKA
jgi:hypothetical protein